MGCSSSVYHIPCHYASFHTKVEPTSNTTTNGVIAQNLMLKQGVCFTDSERRLIEQTWKRLAPKLSELGCRVFLRIVEKCPEVQTSFPGWEYLSREELPNNASFRSHASRFMQAMGAAVEQLEDLEGSFGPLLIGLGKRHVHFTGFKPSYWDFFQVS